MDSGATTIERAMRYASLIPFLLTLGCGSVDDPRSKFSGLDQLLANEYVQQAIAKLPAGTDVAAGAYYKGTTPADISGTWTTDCSGCSVGKWPAGNNFGGTITFESNGPGKIDVPEVTGNLSSGDGNGSFITGTGNNVTAFLQLNLTCKADSERYRFVAVDRFVYSAGALNNYVRSYVVIARDNMDGPWTHCATDGLPGNGSVSTASVWGPK